MNMQSQIRLLAEAGLLHPSKGQFVVLTDDEQASIAVNNRHALLACGPVPTVDDEREEALRNVAVLGYN